MRKFKDGDKVIPISKTVEGYNRISRCRCWNEAKDEQGYLYIAYYSNSMDAYVCSDRDDAKGGSYYNEHDLIPYQLDTETAFEQLVSGRITEKQYEKLTRTTDSEV